MTNVAGFEIPAEAHGYDAFGRPRGRDWQPSPTPGTDKLHASDYGAITERGFTGHEHLDDTYLIHMNGRVYDYRLGRFLSVDPIISNPANSQSINPYSYIGNNPLSGVDPTGYMSLSATDGCGKFARCDVDLVNPTPATQRLYAPSNYSNGGGGGAQSGASAGANPNTHGAPASVSKGETQQLSQSEGEASRRSAGTTESFANAATRVSGTMDITVTGTRGSKDGSPTELQPPGTGIGPILGRSFTTGAMHPSKRAVEIMRALRNNINQFSTVKGKLGFANPADTPFTCTSGPDCSTITKGNVYRIDGPMTVNPYVMTTAATETFLEFTTMRGHPEAARVQFSADDLRAGTVFSIDVWGHPATRVDQMLYLVAGYDLQGMIWSHFVDSVRQFATSTQTEVPVGSR
jgi:RHS repeat-associated protein